MTPDGRQDGATLVKWMGVEGPHGPRAAHEHRLPDMVALGEDGRPTAVRPHEPAGAAGLRRAREAQLRRANRLAERDEIRSQRGG